MSEHLSTIIIAILTGIFSIVTIIIQRKQDKVINKIDEHTIFIERERALEQKLIKAEKEREDIIQQIIILSLKCILECIQHIGGVDQSKVEEWEVKSNELSESFILVSKNIQELSKQRQLVLDITNEFQQDAAKVQGKK